MHGASAKSFSNSRNKPLLAGLPCDWFSSVAGRGNLTKEAPAKVASLALNHFAENPPIHM